MSSPYIDGLKLLGQRELSEAQVRQRLARREHEEAAIDEAIARPVSYTHLTLPTIYSV